AAFSEVWECTGGQQAPQGVLSWYFGGAQTEGLAGDSLRARVEAAVGSAMGDLAGAAHRYSARTGWGTDPYSRGAYVNFAPGQLTRFGHLLWVEDDDGTASQTAQSGPVYFAGEHLSDAFPGYMNGAAQTGRLAADRKSTRLNSSHVKISYAVFCLKKKKKSSKPLTLNDCT